MSSSQLTAKDLLRPVFPDHCQLSPPELNCGERGLSGRIGFDGLGDLSTAGVVRLEWADGKREVLSLSAANPHVRVSGGHRQTATAASLFNFVALGVTHIWLGGNHLLFVLGLLWFVDSGRALVKTITSFTVAHSFTLAAASLGLFTLAPEPVEAVIALSIACLAIEMLRELRSGRSSATRARP